ncbi:MAG TPA: putative peptide modification system cyclase [Rhodanobacteraceae bacterium]|nr:putative peptide modification system cyclase [Rhodanobacteraceae bacterium]
MNAILHAQTPNIEPRHDQPVALLRTLVLCDLADSTALVERLGDLHAAELFRKHDRLARALVHQHGGREIDKTDGFLMMFDRPIAAVAFALAYQRSLRQLDDLATKVHLRARVGIHVGDVIAWDNAPEDIAKGAKPFEVEGLVKPITSRLMGLALPGQILLSGVAYQLAHRAQEELGDQATTALWRTHGRYRFKGLPDPIAVFEVGEQDIAPLKAPPWSGKAHREVPFWRRPATMAIEIALVMLLGALPLWYLLRPEPAIAFAKRDWVVVGNLTNLTGETTFDESVETAFRIGLEQSRYVNVLSDLKTRETVKLMQRDPEKTTVDRTIGSEVAIRDGARALILPTVAEIGGRVRVTAEVIDPQTQTTVWSESADGAGAESVLPSLDKVNQQLRVRLGEALATVSSESQPLEKVATKNLDALRAYSLGQRAYDRNRMKESMALYEQAVKLDPTFALAQVALGKVYVATNQSANAIKAIETAHSLRDRISPRDGLYLDAWQATLVGTPREALGKWALLTQLYPDFFSGQSLYAYHTWEFANQFPAAIEAAEKASSPKNTNSINNEVLLGSLYLGMEDYPKALQHFGSAQAAGLVWTSDYAVVYAAQKQFDKADESVGRSEHSGIASRDLNAYVTEIAIAVDRGDWPHVVSTLDAANKAAAEVDASLARRFRAIDVSLRSISDSESTQAATLGAYIAASQKTLSGEAEDASDIRLELATVAYLAAKRGDVKQASDALSVAKEGARAGDYPMLDKMSAVAEAERTRASGKADDAVAALKPLVDGNELLLTHVALSDAYMSAGHYADAIREAKWVSSHRGRAYAEFNQELTAFNVAQTNLALLRAAEAAQASGDKNASRQSLDAFLKAWPEKSQPAALFSRVTKLEKAF